MSLADPAAEIPPCCPDPGRDLLAEQTAAELSDVFKALADPTRIRLLRYLADSEAGTICACHLPGALGITQPTLSFHMRKLQAAGLVDREQRGRWAHWSINSDALAPVRAFLQLSPAPAATCC